MFKSLIATALLSFSVGAKSIDHRESAATNQSIYVNGSYNFQQSFTFDTDDFDLSDYNIVFDNSDVKSYSNPISFYNSNSSHFYYLSSINFNTNTGVSDLIILTFNIYDVYSVNSFSVRFYDGDYIYDVDSDYADMIINFRNTYILTGDEAKLFKIFFTKEDNDLTTTYNGYYSFNNNISSINNWFFISGAISFNNRVYNVFTNKGDGVVGSSATAICGSYFNIEQNQYYMQSFGLPFDRNYVSSNNVLMSNAKMSKVSYNILTNYGVFAYQHDPTYDDADWKDLLFSVMDSPIYMISRLLNFQLFGINLYLALAGLLTIVIIVFCVRKFL